MGSITKIGLGSGSIVVLVCGTMLLTAGPPILVVSGVCSLLCGGTILYYSVRWWIKFELMSRSNLMIH